MCPFVLEIKRGGPEGLGLESARKTELLSVFADISGKQVAFAVLRTFAFVCRRKRPN